MTADILHWQKSMNYVWENMITGTSYNKLYVYYKINSH